MDAALALRVRRHDAGLSLRALAKKAHTSAATLLQYESSRISPSIATFERIRGAVYSKQRRWTSLDALSSEVVTSLKRGDEVWAWKLCGEVFADEHAGSRQDTELFVQMRPELTGDRRTDALMAALAEHVCARRGISSPTWLHEPRVCAPFWFIVGGLRGYELQALLESPPAFATRGIFVTLADLESA